MAKVPLYPAWSAVRGQALDECGMTLIDENRLHITVMFIGRDLAADKADKCRVALQGAMLEYAAAWRAGVESGRVKIPGRLVGEPAPRAFIPLRFPGQIGVFRNKGGSHVHAICEPSPALLGFRDTFSRLLGFDVRGDFGGYRPHVTLAEGPAGSDLKRPAEVPSGMTRATELVLKIGSEIREVSVF